ncbi:MAG TPA: hypothetical protein VNI55_07975 [Gaiellaceae bacterium]|nr:hypothetical protein [Gaiellaceae bacterium]
MAARDELLELLDSDPELLRGTAARSRALTDPDGRYTDEDVDQIVYAFGTALREGLRDEGTAARDLLIESVVPAVVEQGETAASLARSGALFGALLVGAVTPRLAESAREEAVGWLAEFFGAWCQDVVVAAGEVA